jgi:hypothetical protein
LIDNFSEYKGRHVSFFATLSTNMRYPSGHTVVIFPKVVTNYGAGYNGRTGVFTAPLAGTYFLYATSIPKDDSHRASIKLVVANNEISTTSVVPGQYHSDGDVLGIVRMEAGQRAVVKTRYGGNYFWSHGTQFGGFLIK